MTRYVTAKEIVNRAAVEVGLTPVADVWASTDPAFVQLRTLLNSCGQNMMEAYDWEQLRRQASLTTIDGTKLLTYSGIALGPFVEGRTITGGTSGATATISSVDATNLQLGVTPVTGTLVSGEVITSSVVATTATIDDYRTNGVYDLPVDFDRMIDQTGWDRTNRVPLGGPLTPQEWQYLLGRDLVSYTIYATFRIMEGKWNIFPQPPPVGLDIFYEYISAYWLWTSAADTTGLQSPTGNDNVVLYKPEVIVQYLRYKFLSAKGFPTSDAKESFGKAWEDTTGGDKGAQIVNAGTGRRGIHFLDYYNIPDTNYGGG